MYGDMLNYGAIHQETFAKGLRKYILRSGGSVPELYDQFREALFMYWQVDKEVRLQREPNLFSLRSLCLYCFGVGSSCFVCLDGNFQHRRFKNSASCTTILGVDTAGLFLPNLTESELALTKVVRQKQNACTTDFKADHQEGNRSGTFDETGLMLASCRHDIPLRVLNIVRTGERYAYPLALLRYILSDDHCPPKVVVMYDVACRFISTARAQLTSEQFARLEFRVLSFHITTHVLSCQLSFHPRGSSYAGLAEGESCERIWSQIRHLVSPGRYCSPLLRVMQLERVLLAVGERKRVSYSKYHRTMRERIATLSSEYDRVLVPILNEPITLDATFILSHEFILAQAEDIRLFYSGKDSFVLEAPGHSRRVYELVKSVRSQSRASAERLNAVLRLLSMDKSAEAWLHDDAPQFNLVRRAFIMYDLTVLQKQMFRALSGKMRTSAALSTYTGVRKAKFNMAKLNSMSKSMNATI